MMATILTFSLAGRRDPRYRAKTGETGTIVPFPGVRYERLDDKQDSPKAREPGKAAVSSSGKARYKPDF